MKTKRIRKKNTDTQRLNFIMKMLALYGINGFSTIQWTIYGDGPDIRFDRPAIDRAMKKGFEYLND